MSNELVNQLSVECAIEEASRGQMSDQDVISRIRKAVKANLPQDAKFKFSAPSFDEFFVEADYYHILSLWLSIKNSSGMNFYRRVCYSGSKSFMVDFDITSDKIYIKNSGQRTIYVFMPKIFFEKGFAYIRNCALLAAGLFFEEGYIFPSGVAELFPHACVQVRDDLKDIQNKSLDLIVRLGDLRIFSESLKVCGFNNIYEFCNVTFGLSRTTVKNMLEIYDRFFDHCRLKDDFSDYCYSQLVELCSVDSKDLDKFDESMSVREIKAKKKELAQAASSKSDDSFDNSPVAGDDQASDDVVSVSSEEAEFASKGEARCDDVPAIGFQAAIDAVKEMQNPYYVPGKEKQSARCDAYQNALHDVLEKLDQILVESLKSAVEA